MTDDRLDWQVWHRDYDDPDSSVSHRLVEVRERLAGALAARPGPVRLLSLCSGDARDTAPGRRRVRPRGRGDPGRARPGPRRASPGGRLGGRRRRST